MFESVIKLLKLNKHQVIWKALGEISGANTIYIYSCKLVVMAEYEGQKGHCLVAQEVHDYELHVCIKLKYSPDG